MGFRTGLDSLERESSLTRAENRKKVYNVFFTYFVVFEILTPTDFKAAF
jgi:hypothetical protein